MAIRKTGSRSLVVDGVAYRWRIRHRDPEPDNRGWGWAFAVQHAETPGTTLIVRLTRRHPRWDRTTTPVTPSEIANCIRQAILKGWQPTMQGSPFHLVSEVGHVSEEDGRQ
jgi:hypothetical protein